LSRGSTLRTIRALFFELSAIVRSAERIMYAVFQSGGKQHRVAEGQTVRLEKIEVAPGDAVEFDNILMVSNGDDIKIGTPYVNGGKVTAEVVTHGRGEKIKIVKFRRRKHSRSQMGHRQWFTEVKITGIQA
jgi:large subunit ribosomal protein L21